MNIEIHDPMIMVTQDGVEFSAKIDAKDQDEVLKAADFIANSKSLNMCLERAYDKRSLNANALFWAMCEKLADGVGTSNDEMYHMLLERYGTAEVVSGDLSLRDDLLNMLKARYKMVKELGLVTIDGRQMIQFFCYRGTHEYNTKQMSRLIKGTMEDCAELGIPTEPKRIIDKAIKEWET